MHHAPYRKKRAATGLVEWEIMKLNLSISSLAVSSGFDLAVVGGGAAGRDGIDDVQTLVEVALAGKWHDDRHTFDFSMRWWEKRGAAVREVCTTQQLRCARDLLGVRERVRGTATGEVV